ncbi:hypothetical protein GTY65_35955 [Streptomyces sp. SID8379]|uniref:hypothetical protein n=1 Tax=unclassified Streptomyces TaxID=2593676 RepID=UPI00035F3383|nr:MULTISPECIES: hypothetical protein [unclassified Streptomyces]MYW69426.1 hypothetical protein [Streptomyces sp. SID8379]
MAGHPEHPPSERFSVTLVPPAVVAVNELAENGHVSKADVINRAVLLGFVERERAKGHELMIRTEDGELERIHIL